MNWIEHIVEPTRLLLAWQAPEGIGNGKRFCVGELSSTPTGVVLKYARETADEEQARKLGYTGYPSFRLDSPEHRSGVLEVFLRRLPPRSRADFGAYLENLRIRSSEHLSDLALLGYSGGKLPSDGFSLVHPFEDVDGPCELMVEVAGCRYHIKETEGLHLGQTVAFEFEKSNAYDPNAIQITCEGRRIGYVNRLQTAAFSRWIGTGSIEGVIEKLNGKPGRPRVLIFVRVRPCKVPAQAA